MFIQSEAHQSTRKTPAIRPDFKLHISRKIQGYPVKGGAHSSHRRFDMNLKFDTAWKIMLEASLSSEALLLHANQTPLSPLFTFPFSGAYCSRLASVVFFLSSDYESCMYLHWGLTNSLLLFRLQFDHPLGLSTDKRAAIWSLRHVKTVHSYILF